MKSSTLHVLRREVAIAGVALLVALAAGSLLIILARRSPLDVWAAMVVRTFGDPYAVGQVLFKATPLVFTGLAVSVPLAAGLFNIGGYGQMVGGAMACAVVGAALPVSTPALIALPLCLLAAMIVGGALGATTGALRAYRGAHEVIVAIMLNAIIAGAVLWLGNAALFVGEATRTAPIVAGAQLPSLGIAGSAANVSTLLAIAVAALVAWWQSRTRVGLDWRLVGQSPAAALAAGIDPRRAWLASMAVAGALAGLAAANTVLGYKHAYEEGVGRGAGFLGIAVALIGRGHAAGVIAGALLLGFLSHAGLVVADLVPKELVDVLQAVIVLAVAATAPVLRRHLGGRA
jgi:simple sugar transport system permease protein